MKFLMLVFLCAARCIFGDTVHEVYDTRQVNGDISDPVIAGEETQLLENSNKAELKSNNCLDHSFGPKKRDVSQIHIIFPTNGLIKAWGNDNYQIGFYVLCGFHVGDQPEFNDNINWYKFYQKKVTLDPSVKLTRFTMDVGKCKTGDYANRVITGIQILYKIPHLENQLSVGGLKTVNSALGCERVNNFKTVVLSHIPDNSSDIHFRKLP